MQSVWRIRSPRPRTGGAIVRAEVVRLGPYSLVERIASAGPIVTYLARGPESADHVIVRTLAADDDALAVPRFLAAARSALALEHPNVQRVLEVGCIDDTYLVVLEHVPGRSVQHALAAACVQTMGMPLAFGLTVTAMAATGLHHAHELGIVHGALSTATIVAGFDGSVKVVDLGMDPAEAGLAPEQRLDMPLDRRADVFALGLVLRDLTTGSRAGWSEDTEAQLAQVVATALEPDLWRRYASAAELGAAVELVACRAGLELGPRVVAEVIAELFGDRDEITRTRRRPRVVTPDAESEAARLALPPEEPPAEPASTGVTLGRRVARWIAIAAIGTAVGAWALWPPSSPPPSRSPARTVPAAPPVAPPCVAAPPPAPAAASITIRVVTRPPNASVYLDAARFGKSPVEITVTPSRTHGRLRLRRRGHRTEELDVPLDRDTDVIVALERDR